jgi:hypothetical protein
VDGTWTAPAQRARRHRLFGWFGRTGRIGRGTLALGRFSALCAVASVGALPLVAIGCLSRALLDDGTRQNVVHGPYHTWALLVAALLGCGVVRMRWLVRRTRRLVGRWCGVWIPDPYRPAPGATDGRWRRTGWLLTDPATWRDLLWTGLHALTALLVLLLPLGMLGAYGVSYVFVGPPTVPPGKSAPPAPLPDVPPLPTHGRGLTGPVHNLLAGEGVAVSLAALLCCGTVLVLLLTAPRLLAGYGRLAGLLLGPSREARLSERVTHLAATRSDTIDSGAAEMRRIERDLHDGAQARLVAMGMTLNAAEQLFASHPDAALALLTEAKASSVKALAELRDLVRGIHPPVLADRGLVDAVRALALDLPLPARVDGTLPARAAAPVESAAYFAVSELLANVSKHAGAHRVWIDIGHTGRALRIGVTDDGRGGADPSRGTGLRGLERRLAAFDGVLAVSSPPGGPTIASLEIPCALSSPKTSSC